MFYSERAVSSGHATKAVEVDASRSALRPSHFSLDFGYFRSFRSVTDNVACCCCSSHGSVARVVEAAQGRGATISPLYNLQVHASSKPKVNNVWPKKEACCHIFSICSTQSKWQRSGVHFNAATRANSKVYRSARGFDAVARSCEEYWSAASKEVEKKSNEYA